MSRFGHAARHGLDAEAAAAASARAGGGASSGNRSGSPFGGFSSIPATSGTSSATCRRCPAALPRTGGGRIRNDRDPVPGCGAGRLRVPVPRREKGCPRCGGHGRVGRDVLPGLPRGGPGIEAEPWRCGPRGNRGRRNEFSDPRPGLEGYAGGTCGDLYVTRMRVSATPYFETGSATTATASFAVTVKDVLRRRGERSDDLADCAARRSSRLAGPPEVRLRGQGVKNRGPVAREVTSTRSGS